MGDVTSIGGLNDFIFFKAHFLSVNIFQGEGGVLGVFLMKCCT